MEKKDTFIRLSKSQPLLKIVLLIAFFAFQGLIILFLSGNITIFRLIGYFIETNGYLLLGAGIVYCLLFIPQRERRILLKVFIFFFTCGLLLVLGKWFQSHDQTPLYYGFENIFVFNYFYSGLAWLTIFFAIQRSSILYNPQTGDLVYRKDHFTQVKEKRINLKTISHIVIITYGAKVEMRDLKRKKGWHNLPLEKLGTYTSNAIHMKIHFLSESDEKIYQSWNIGALIDSTTVFYRSLPIFYQNHLKLEVFGKIGFSFYDTTKGRQSLTGNDLLFQNIGDDITQYCQEKNLMLPSMVPSENQISEIFQKSHSRLKWQTTPAGYILNLPNRMLKSKIVKFIYIWMLILSFLMILLVFIIIRLIQTSESGNPAFIQFIQYLLMGVPPIILGIISFYGLFSHYEIQILNDKMNITQLIGKNKIVSIIMPITYIAGIEFKEKSFKNEKTIEIHVILLGGKDLPLWDGPESFFPEIMKFYQNILTIKEKYWLEQRELNQGLQTKIN
ncbi:hypothetical protein [Candidatus Lokiarchaeum ossiferum]|uniref:hypothetical protein n=1 Tax=Candidatus Lokiarchaeum ossiferum TaxID=2951803 RepID=UPI00352C27CF